MHNHRYLFQHQGQGENLRQNIYASEMFDDQEMSGWENKNRPTKHGGRENRTS